MKSEGVPVLKSQPRLMDDDLAKQGDWDVLSAVQVDRGKTSGTWMAEIVGTAFDTDDLKPGFQEPPKDLFILQRHKPLAHALGRQRLTLKLQGQEEPLSGQIAWWNWLTAFGEDLQETLSKRLETLKRLLNGAAEIRGVVQRGQRDHDAFGLGVRFKFHAIEVNHLFSSMSIRITCS